ncbi:class I SAM-dependent methyltransferase [Terrimonas sp.]|uniref:class I SAM-dependent methyltransferase n=1 Tax=Terrimonas sp. TaxID=1914338 RepID=UPI001401C6AD|nr:class I SAM-dependent methyltransferase [Terrimonas sp.]
MQHYFYIFTRRDYFMKQSSWNKHYDALTKTAPLPAATLSFALEQFNKEHIDPAQKTAIDLGFGSGIDSMALLNDGWNLTAMDKDATAIKYLRQLALPHYAARLKIIHKSFEEIALHPALLINATFSLPFCVPQHFPALWKNIRLALQPGGRFAGQFFGMEDSWRAREDMTFHTPALLQELFTGFSVEQMEETKREGRTVGGALKHWHVFHIVAQYR